MYDDRERTLVLIKPDAVRGKHIGKIISIYEDAGLSIQEIKILNPMSSRTAEFFYAEHQGKDFYFRLVEFMTSGVTIALHLVGPTGTIEKVRRLNGDTDPSKAEAETIRRRFGTAGPANAVHASATVDDAARELALIFRSL